MTSQRLLTLLSLLQATREWSGGALAERLGVSERTVRRDVDRLRELGYEIRATKGPDGGYRLQAGSSTPPIYFDDDQVVAIAIALGSASGTGAGITDSAARALATVRQVLPGRLRARVDAVELTAIDRTGGAAVAVQASPDVLLALGAAIRAHEELRFDYDTDGRPGLHDRPPRQVQPHHLVPWSGRWYLIAWEPGPGQWRTYRADRITPRIPTGPRFTPRTVPGADVGAFLSARFKGADDTSSGWPCTGEVVLHAPVAAVAPFARDGVADPLDSQRTRLRLGSWSWPALAALFAQFDAEIDVLGPPELVHAFAQLSARAARAARAQPPGQSPSTVSPCGREFIGSQPSAVTTTMSSIRAPQAPRK
ncbi:helix-turn-helix transcriptional regulator [Rhodococcus sp. NPDC055112]